MFSKMHLFSSPSVGKTVPLKNQKKKSLLRNFALLLFEKQSKHSLVGNTDIIHVADNKTLWRTLKSFFTDRVNTPSKNIIIEKS